MARDMRRALLALPGLVLATGCVSESMVEPGAVSLARPDRALPGWCTSVVTDGEGRVHSQSVTEWEPIGTTWRKLVRRFDSDPVGVLSEHDEVNRYTYGADGHVVEETDSGGDGPDYWIATWTLAESVPRAAPGPKPEWDERDRIARVESWSIRDPAGRKSITISTHDDAGHLLRSEADWQNDGTLDWVTTDTWENGVHLRTESDSGADGTIEHVTTYGTAGGRIVSSKTTEHGVERERRSWEYDAEGRVVAMTMENLRDDGTWSSYIVTTRYVEEADGIRKIEEISEGERKRIETTLRDRFGNELESTRAGADGVVRMRVERGYECFAATATAAE